mmetsp:Transcript_48027/g.139101  ORF Transcript_48027/g.139101 Transcript_48027/m.139101 type:complete len:253 (+) Transcript_48027:364-1122(+)
MSEFPTTSSRASWRPSMATWLLSLKQQCLMTPVELSLNAMAAFLLPVKVLLTNVTWPTPDTATPELCFEVTVQSVMQACPRSTRRQGASLTMLKPFSRGDTVVGPSSWKLAGEPPAAVSLACSPVSLPMSVTGLVRISSSLYVPGATRIVVGGHAGAPARASPIRAKSRGTRTACFRNDQIVESKCLWKSPNCWPGAMASTRLRTALRRSHCNSGRESLRQIGSAVAPIAQRSWVPLCTCGAPEKASLYPEG